MVYDENHNPEKLLTQEVVLTWVFCVSLVAVLLLIIGMAK